MSARRLIASVCSLATACSLALPVAGGVALAGAIGVSAATPAAAATRLATGSTTATTTPVLGGIGPTTTTTAPPGTAPTTAPPVTSAPRTAAPAPGSPTTTKAPGTKAPGTATAPSKPPAGVPSVPVGGPPTTAPAPGAQPAPQPDPGPIVAQVDGQLAQLAAISDLAPAHRLVAVAQDRVTTASTHLLAARQGLQRAESAQQQAAAGKRDADQHLKAMAVAAYIGVGYSTPGFSQPAGGNGDQGTGTVSTPGGLSGIEALDAKEMLILVGERTRQDASDATAALDRAMKVTAGADRGYQAAQAGVASAEANLLAAQQTLQTVTAAAVNPVAAAATPLPDLTVAARTGIAPPPPPPATDATGTGTLTAASTTRPGAAPASPTILGAPVLTGPELAAWYASTGHKANATVPMDQLAAAYASWGRTLGVRDDVAFAQSIVETGYFSFPAGGQLTDKDNNFAGIGACDSCAHGWSFPDASTGVEAQLELLHDYATSRGLPKGVKNVIGGTGVGGCCATWTKLAGVWASSTVYGISIMTVYSRMLAWIIPQREAKASLITPTDAATQGPELAPLPGAAQSTTTARTPHQPAGATPASARVNLPGG